MLNTDDLKRRLESLKSDGKECFRVEGKELANRVQEIIREGKARKITIKKGHQVLAEFPLAVGVGGAAVAILIAPTLAAVAAIGTLMSSVEVVIHRHPQDGDEVRSVEYDEVD